MLSGACSVRLYLMPCGRSAVPPFRRYGHTRYFHLDPVARIILDFNVAIQSKQIFQTSGL